VPKKMEMNGYLVGFAVDFVNLVDALGINNGAWRPLTFTGRLCVVDETVDGADVL